MARSRRSFSPPARAQVAQAALVSLFGQVVAHRGDLVPVGTLLGTCAPRSSHPRPRSGARPAQPPRMECFWTVTCNTPFSAALVLKKKKVFLLWTAGKGFLSSCGSVRWADVGAAWPGVAGAPVGTCAPLSFHPRPRLGGRTHRPPRMEKVWAVTCHTAKFSAATRDGATRGTEKFSKWYRGRETVAPLESWGGPRPDSVRTGVRSEGPRTDSFRTGVCSEGPRTDSVRTQCVPRVPGRCSGRISYCKFLIFVTV